MQQFVNIVLNGLSLGMIYAAFALALVLMRLRGYGWEQVLHSHPSGAVGQLHEAPDALPPLTLDAPAGAGR